MCLRKGWTCLKGGREGWVCPSAGSKVAKSVPELNANGVSVAIESRAMSSA